MESQDDGGVSDIAAVRGMKHPSRIRRLNEVVQAIEGYGRCDELLLDEGVVIMLEIIREAFPKESAFEVYALILGTKQGLAWDLLGQRMLATQEDRKSVV